MLGDWVTGVIMFKSANHFFCLQSETLSIVILYIFFRCADVTVKLQLCTEQLSQVSDIMPHIEVCTCVMWFVSTSVITFTSVFLIPHMHALLWCMLPCLQLPEDGSPLTIQWMQIRLEEINAEKSRILNEKRSDNTKLAKHKESVLSELEKLRGLNRAHRKLMVEIWQHLTALAKVG